MGDNEKKEIHLDVYLDRQELHMSNVVKTYYEGMQSAAAKQRYEKIKETLSTDFLQRKLDGLDSVDFSELSVKNRQLLEALVNGVSSEKGRGLLGVAFLQLVIKTITPEQSVRLHKSSNQRGNFSWKDGISMRTLNSKYTGKFLKDNGLLNSNKFGSFMTRTLAENYPFSKLYKAEIRGPFDEWIDIVDAIEDNTMPAELALSYLMLLLKRNADASIKRNRTAIASRTAMEIWTQEKTNVFKAIRLLGFLPEDKIDVEQYQQILETIFKENANILSSSNTSDRSSLKRMIRIYDFLLYRQKKTP